MKEHTQRRGRTVGGSKFDPVEAKKRCEAASPEPWSVGTGLAYNVCSELADTEPQSIVCENIDSYVDADFIAHARSDLPAALEALEEAQGRLAILRKLSSGQSEDVAHAYLMLREMQGKLKAVREWAAIQNAMEGPVRTWCVRCEAYVEEGYSSGEEFCKVCRKMTAGDMDTRLDRILHPKEGNE